ncbi:hypothetical protein [Cupriavidus pauculus]|uniref:hypothetical protein n=1 Tax=Cupriavidus pauculus TaxID=82633 RepID=UPI003857F12F
MNAHRAAKWLLHNLGFPIAAVVLTAAGSVIYMSMEIDARSYRYQQNAVRFADAEYRHLVGAALSEDGKLTRWENAGLYRDFWSHASSMTADMSEPGSREAEREALAKAVNVTLPSGH